MRAHLMNILRFFTQEERIAGLAITEEAVRLVFLERNPKTGETVLALKEEESLDVGVVSEGLIKDKDALTGALKKLIEKTGSRLKYFIVSIPGDQVYYKIFTFPKSVTSEKVREAMELTTSFQLPFPKESVYLDWEQTASSKDSGEFSVALSALKKDVADDYLLCLKKAGIRAIALEVHPMSTLRLVEVSDDAILAIDERTSGATFAMIKNGAIQFLRTIPSAFTNKDLLKKEITKIRNFYESDNGKIAQELRKEELTWREEYVSYGVLMDDRTRWMTALGAALRATVERSEDTFMSLMPIGTEKAYEYQRAAAFSVLITNIVVGLSFFFALSFFASYELMMTIQEGFSKQNSDLSAVSTPADMVDTELHAQTFNTLVGTAGSVVKTLPKWSGFLEELMKLIPKEITINTLSIPSPEGTIAIAGISKDRATLNAFRKTLQGWPTITNVNLPNTNLEQTGEIPFQASFNITNPSEIYNWK